VPRAMQTGIVGPVAPHTTAPGVHVPTVAPPSLLPVVTGDGSCEVSRSLGGLPDRERPVPDAVRSFGQARPGMPDGGDLPLRALAERIRL